MAKEEIKSLINDLGTEGFAEYSYNKTFAEKVAAMFNKGDKLVASMLFDDVDKMTPYEAQYITEWNTIAENLGDMYKIVSNCEDLSEIIVNCTVDFSQGMAVLDAVENDCDYTGEYSRYYQNAVDEFRLEFGNYIYNALSRVLNFAAKKVMEEGLSNLRKNVLGAYAKSYSLAKLFYKALDMVGDYKVGKDYVDYMMKMLSYTNAEKNFEEAFQAIVDGDTSDAAKIRLACRFDTVRRCAYRALEKLTSIGYGYDKGIDMQGAFNLYKELYYHTTCPFVVSQ